MEIITTTQGSIECKFDIIKITNNAKVPEHYETSGMPNKTMRKAELANERIMDDFADEIQEFADKLAQTDKYKFINLEGFHAGGGQFGQTVEHYNEGENNQ